VKQGDGELQLLLRWLGSVRRWPAAAPNQEGAGVVQGREEPNPSIMRARGSGRGYRAEILAWFVYLPVRCR
jgi:hypothetical protein